MCYGFSASHCYLVLFLTSDVSEAARVDVFPLFVDDSQCIYTFAVSLFSQLSWNSIVFYALQKFSLKVAYAEYWGNVDCALCRWLCCDISPVRSKCPRQVMQSAAYTCSRYRSGWLLSDYRELVSTFRRMRLSDAGKSWIFRTCMPL